MVLLPILSHQGHLNGRQVYATCIGVIFPACAISAVVYLLRGGVALSEAPAVQQHPAAGLRSIQHRRKGTVSGDLPFLQGINQCAHKMFSCSSCGGYCGVCRCALCRNLYFGILLFEI